MHKKFSYSTSVVCMLVLFAFSSAFPVKVQAQTPTCVFYPVSIPLNDLGTNEYYRLTSINPLTYQATGFIGGLYPGGSNQRPADHEAAGLEIAREIQPLDEAGNPTPNGRIGFASVGMSNTSMEFGGFIQRAYSDPSVNDRLLFANSAAGGGVIERWVDPTNAYYNQTWNFFNQQITNYGLTQAQVQVVWVKITQFKYQPNFPADMYALRDQYKLLMNELHDRLPNLKLVFFSSRTRSFSYLRGLSPEPTALENGFAVRWLIEDQMNGDPQLNFNPENGAVNSPYISWGPYLWIDGLNPRLDGRIWPISNVTSDCTHPSDVGGDEVVDIMMEFFKSDVLATSWFLNPGIPIPTSTSQSTQTPTPTDGPPQIPTETPTLTRTPTPTVEPSSTSTPSATATPTATVFLPPTLTPTPTSTPAFQQSPTSTPITSSHSLISSWGFGTDLVMDEVNGTTDGMNHNATWFTPSIASGAYQFNGTDAYLDLSAFPYLRNLSSFTISVWVRPSFNQTYGSWSYVFSSVNSQLFYLPARNDWRFTLRTTTSNYRVDTQDLQWPSDSWHLLTATYDGASVKLYWDGQLNNVIPASGPVYSGSGNAYLGKSYSSPPSCFFGAIDELKVFNDALSAFEVYELYTPPRFDQ